MKKKKSFVALALVVAVLVLGVGYALTTIDLKVNGDITVSPDDSNFDVNFTDAKITTAGTLAGQTDAATKGDGKTATLSVKTLKTVGEKVVVEYTITNNSKLVLTQHYLIQQQHKQMMLQKIIIKLQQNLQITMLLFQMEQRN